MQMKVKYLFPNIPELISNDGDSGYDIRAAIEAPQTINAGKMAHIPTGIAVELEPSHPIIYPDVFCQNNNAAIELQVRPRSGHTKRGIVAQFGTIDASYRGEIWVNILNTNDYPVTIEPLERIAQIVVCPIHKPTITTAKVLSETKRGEKGFGSTGKD